MMKYLDWVDAYLAGELTSEQQTEFETALAASEELKVELNFARQLQTVFAFGPPDETATASAARIADLHQQERRALFQAFVHGNLSAGDRRTFRERLLTDELFAFEWERFTAAMPMGAKTVRPHWVYWAAAASVLAVLGFFTWWMFSKTAAAPEALFARYDNPELTPKSEYALVNEGLHHKGIIGSKAFDTLKIKGLEAYDQKDWDNTIALLSEYLGKAKPSVEETPDEINLINLFVGRAWLEKGNTVKAVGALKKADAGVVDIANYGLLQELIRWQLALAYLKNNDPAAAKNVLLPLQNAQQETIRRHTRNLLNELK